MAWTRAAAAPAVAVALAVALVSGGSRADPRTPAGPAGLPAPFLGTALVGQGQLTAAVDSYGDVVDLRPVPAGPAWTAVSAARQAAGTVPAQSGIVPRLEPAGGGSRPFWRADMVRQRYRQGTNVLVVSARFGSVRAEVEYAAGEDSLACLTRASSGARVSLAVTEPGLRDRLRCDDAAARAIFAAARRSDRRWLARRQPLGAGAPAWARRMYRRSLLTLHALTGARSGAVAAGARDGWAYVWPRDAAATALALAASGYRVQARRIARFLHGLDLGSAARFDGSGGPVSGRSAQGDAAGWVAVAAHAAGLSPSSVTPSPADAPDYREQSPGSYLGNAIAAAAAQSGAGPQRRGPNRRRVEVAVARGFGTARGLVRVAGQAGSGLDSAAAWAVQPFPLPSLFPAARETLLRLVSQRTRFGIAPGEGWNGADPWTAPTAWSAWSLAALALVDRRSGHSALVPRDREAALALLTDLRRAATPAGELPERVGARSGLPRSTTPLAWSHAFAILALRQLWPTPSSRGSLATKYVSKEPRDRQPSAGRRRAVP